jgi:hypothetical protein
MRNCLLLLISVAGLAQAAPPATLEVSYEVSAKGITLADIVEHLVHGNGQYELVESWHGRGIFALRGSARRTSRGDVVDGRLRPVEFTDERTGRDTARARFDWAAKTLTMEYKEGPNTRPIPPNAQDRLSFLLAFAFLPQDGQPVKFSVADGRGVSDYTFDRVGTERVKTPAGEFDAVKIVRRKDGPGDHRSTEIWLAPAQGLIPVRIRVTEKDGTVLDQVAARISVQAK